jgi:hypothetical protein
VISIHDLLEDPSYKSFFCTPPKLPPSARRSDLSPPWILYVKLHGDPRWRRREHATYADAFKQLRKLMHEGRVWDAAINSKRCSFAPPMRIVRVKGQYMIDSTGTRRQVTKQIEWRPRLPADEVESHRWCPYCRRATVFRYYSKHHALGAEIVPGVRADGSVQRCCICGASERVATYNRASENRVPVKQRRK